MPHIFSETEDEGENIWYNSSTRNQSGCIPQVLNNTWINTFCFLIHYCTRYMGSTGFWQEVSFKLRVEILILDLSESENMIHSFLLVCLWCFLWQCFLINYKSQFFSSIYRYYSIRGIYVIFWSEMTQLC